MEPAPFGHTAEVGFSGRAIGGRREARVSAAAALARRGEQTRARRRQVAEDLTALAIADDRADGNAQHEIVPVRTVAIGALAVRATPGLVVALVVVVEQRVQRGIGLEPDTPAGASVTAVRPSAGYVLLAAEADTAGPPVAALHEDIDLIDEIHLVGGAPAPGMMSSIEGRHGFAAAPRTLGGLGGARSPPSNWS